MAINKCSLDNMLNSVLSIGNTEKNQTYPPNIYESQYNAVTSILISAIADKWPSSHIYIDVIEPFLKNQILPIKNGFVEMPDDKRNFLDAAIFFKKENNKTTDCGCWDTSETGFADAIRRNGCSSKPIEIVNQSEWDDRTTSSYNYPTHENPIGCFFGDNKLKICPFDVERVQVRYIRNENIYRYGYIMQPDDTYIYNKDTSVESEWTSAAFKYIFSGLTSLYAAYTRNTELRDWSTVINKQGIL